MNMAGYTKLFNSILASTIWREDDKTRIVWITLLAMADKNGVAEGSIPGLADMARVSVEDCERALIALESPDKYSRTKEYEGRRIETLAEGGWQILNHGKYRAKMSADERREYNKNKQAEWRARQKASNIVNDCKSQSTLSTHADAQSDADAKAVPPTTPPLPPKAGGGIVEGKQPDRIPTTEQSRRIAAIFHRRPDTAWTTKEILAYRLLGTIPEEDIAAVERYYSKNWPPTRGVNILRTDLLTFLNNFPGEVGRAHASRLAPAVDHSAQKPGRV